MIYSWHRSGISVLAAVVVIASVTVLSSGFVFSDVVEPQTTPDDGLKSRPTPDVPLALFDPQPVTQPRNLFHQYMTRGLYPCSSKYVHTLSKLHALIKEAFEEYSACELELKKSPGPKSTENAFLDQLLSELDDEEDAQALPSKRSGILQTIASRTR